MYVQMAWKEYRSLRTLWSWIAAFGVVCVAIGGGFSDGLGYRAGCIAVTVLGLAAAAALFAGEQEAGTWRFFERLPVDLGEIWLAKLRAIALAQAALFLVVTTSAAMFSSGPGFSGELLLGLGICMPEALAWGTLCACTIRRTLTSAAAAGTAMLAVYLVLSLITPELNAVAPPREMTITSFLAGWWWLRLILACAALSASWVVLQGVPLRRRRAVPRPPV